MFAVNKRRPQSAKDPMNRVRRTQQQYFFCDNKKVIGSVFNKYPNKKPPRKAVKPIRAASVPDYEEALTTRQVLLHARKIYYYRPQTKFAKVMFLQVSVILSTGGRAWLPRGGGMRGYSGGMRGCSGGACMVAPGGGGVRGCSGGRAWLLRGACMVALGVHAWLLWGGHAWLFRGACMVAPGGHAWLLPGGMRGCSRDGGMCGCSGGCMVALGGGMHGCSGGCMVAPGGWVVAPGEACVVAPGGHVWLLRGGPAWLFWGGHAWFFR